MTDVAVIAARLGLYLTLAITFGLPCFVLWAWRDDRRSPPVPWASIVGIATLLAMILSVFQLIALAASMSGTTLTAVDRATISMLLDGGAMGRAWKVRVGALLVILMALILTRRAPGASRTVSAAGGGVALATMAWFGHGASDEGAAGWTHLMADLAHLWAAGVWTGALVGLSWLLLRSPNDASHGHAALCERALGGFSGLGTLIVATLVVTGLINTWFLIGIDHIASLMADPYGRLLLVKLAAFGCMIVLAALNRYRLTPALERVLKESGDAARSLSRLRVSLLTETAMLATILGLVAWFGTLPPPAGG
jgi:putative copper resistance protein D